MSGVLDFLSVPARQASVLDDTSHRPWPLPDGTWLMAQTWSDLAFLHWRVDADALRARVPASVELDLHEGEAWLGVTPFRLEHLRMRGTVPVPRLSSFLETNVRTYVTAGGRPGIWFFSLDCESPVGVEAARRLYRLPYFRARMGARGRGRDVDYRSTRTDPRGHRAELRVAYGRRGDGFRAAPGSLEHFLTERYCLYATDGSGALYRAEIHHPPWRLRRGEAQVGANTMPPPGIEVDDDPHVLVGERQDVVIWPLERV